MKKAIKTKLFASKAPLEWGIIANSQLYTTQIPINTEGNIVTGGIEAQVRQTMDNLKHTLEAANMSMGNVTQVLIYVTDRAYLVAFNKIYVSYFNTTPYPNRAALIVSGLAREEMLCEIVAYAVE